MKQAYVAICLLMSMLTTARAESLAGTWRFALDREDIGITQKWFETALPDHVQLPGGLTEQGIGDEVDLNTPWTGSINDRSYFTSPQYAAYREPGNIKIPFWLQPTKYYAGAAWYQRDVDVPSHWAEQTLRLTLERPHIVTHAWIDSRDLGSADSLAAPHQFEIEGLAPGKHTLTIRVDNLHHVDVGLNSHSVSDNTQGNWNGIVGNIDLKPLGAAWIENLRIDPKILPPSIHVTGTVHGTNRGPVELICRSNQSVNAAKPISAQVHPDATGNFTCDIMLDHDANLWDEFSHALYTLEATPAGGMAESSTFGLREIGTSGPHLTINGRPLFLRGTLDCALFPKTGHPPTDRESWRKEFATVQDYGLNHVRFHSWCPPEAAFDAADEMGVYLQIECSSWATTSTSLGDGKPVEAYLYSEAERILKCYGNHPSFILMPYGNEPGGKNRNAYLSKWVSHFKELDSRRLYTSGSGWPVIVENQFDVVPEPRIQRWNEGLASRVNAMPPETTADYIAYNADHYHGTPVISHEIGQWCAYPNFDEIKKYTGYLKPKNFEIFQASLASHHMADQAHDFLTASGKHQAGLYKEDIEAALRTTNMSGFQLLGLQDFSGQGTALVGVLDAFWDSKGYISGKEFRRFCAPVVPLARLTKRAWTSDETFTAGVEAANFGAVALLSAKTSWRLRSDDGHSVASGDLPPLDLNIGNGQSIGSVSIPLKNLPRPARYKFTVTIAGEYENDWDVWIYPPRSETPLPEGLYVTDKLDAAAMAVLSSGQKVFWLVPPKLIANDANAPVVFGFSPIFWNTAWTKRQPPTTLGILCDAASKAFLKFPTEDFSDWQWWYPMAHAQPMILDALPSEVRPTIQVIDDWFTNRKLGLAFEAKVGGGKLFVCSIDLDNAHDPVNAQLRRSLLDYVGSDAFDPKVSVTEDQLSSLLAPLPGQPPTTKRSL